MELEMKFLLDEDELKMASLLLGGFPNNGHAADVTRTGEDAVWMAAASRYDAILLDVMLPGMDGFETLAELRKSGRWTPVLILTARDAVEDRIAGLDVGADDYLTKPFSFAELLARLRAIVRRGELERPSIVRSARARSRPCAVPGTGCARTDDESSADPDPVDVGVHGGDERRARGDRPVSLFPTRIRARPNAQPGAQDARRRRRRARCPV